MRGYNVSDYMRTFLTEPLRDYMMDLDIFFCENDIYQIAVRDLKVVKRENLVSVLKTISGASLGWSKPFEHIEIKEFTKENSHGWSLTNNMSRSTAERALKVLMGAGLVLKFSIFNGQELYFGINIPRVIELADDHLGSLICIDEIIRLRLEKWHQLKLSLLIEELQKFMVLFAGRRICDIREIQEIIKQYNNGETS